MLRIPGYQWIGSWTSGNSYENNGQQPKILLHMTVSSGLSMSYAQSHPYPPQSWANVYTGDKWQSVELDRAGMALYQPPYSMSWLNKNWFGSQTELVGVPVVNQKTYSDQQCRWIGENVIAPIWQAFNSVGINVDLNNVRYHADSSGSASEYWHGRLSDADFFNFNGILCHIDAYGNDHWDCSVEDTLAMASYARAFLGQGGGPGPKPPVEDEDDDMKYRTFIDDTNTTYVVDGIYAMPIGNPAIYNTLVAAGMAYTPAEQDAKGWAYRYPRQYMVDVFKIVEMSEIAPDKPF